MNPCNNCGALYDECGECGEERTDEIIRITNALDDSERARIELRKDKDTLMTGMDGLRTEIAALKAEVDRLRKLCGEAAEQFNRCHDPAMVSRLAAAERGEETK